MTKVSTNIYNKLPPAWLLTLAIFAYGCTGYLALKNRAYTIRPDSLEYMALSHNLRQHFVFSKEPSPPFTPELFRLPGYPLFLASVGAIDDSSVTHAVIAQCIMGLLLFYLMWSAFVDRGGPTAAGTAAAILALDLITILHAPIILAEMCLELFLVIALAQTLQWRENGSRRHLFCAAGAWGVASVIKPIALFPMMTVCAVLLLFRFRKAAFFSLIAVALPFAWAIHNSVSAKHATFTSQSGYALLLYPASGALAIAEKIPMEDASRRLEQEIHAQNPALVKGSIEESVAYKRKAIDVMIQYPLATLEYHLMGVVRILGGTGLEMLVQLYKKPAEWNDSGSEAYQAIMRGKGTRALLRRFPALIPVQISYMLFLMAAYIFYIGGCYREFKSENFETALLLLLPFLAILAVSCHQGYYRFRIPLMPFVAFGAGYFFQKKETHFTAV